MIEIPQFINEYINDPRNIVEIDPSRRRCVDGRYPPNSNSVRYFARPGADFGYVQTALAVNNINKIWRTPQECVDTIYGAIVDLSGTFTMHTDYHARIISDGKILEDAQKPLIGCGHAQKAITAASDTIYLVEPAIVREAVEDVVGRDRTNVVNLKGEHQEEAVLQVVGRERGIKPMNKDHMFFVNNPTLDKEFIDRLVKAIDHTGFESKDFQDLANLQTMATLRRLAAGKSVFEINIDNPQPSIRYAFVIPQV